VEDYRQRQKHTKVYVGPNFAFHRLSHPVTFEIPFSYKLQVKCRPIAVSCRVLDASSVYKGLKFACKQVVLRFRRQNGQVKKFLDTRKFILDSLKSARVVSLITFYVGKIIATFFCCIF
jgi:hypothetical protein